MDFPDSRTVRVFSDVAEAPDGFGPEDHLMESYAFGGGVELRSIQGGTGGSHFVCFEGNGMLSSSTSIDLTLAAGQQNQKRPSTPIRDIPCTHVSRPWASCRVPDTSGPAGSLGLKDCGAIMDNGAFW